MFAPPPVSALSRAQIEAKRAELQQKRTSSVGSADLQRAESGGQSPKAESKRRPFSTNKKDVEEIRVGEAEQWKLFSRKGKSKLRSGSDASSLLTVPPTPSTASNLLPPPPPVPTGSDGGSIFSLKEDVKEEETSAPLSPRPGMRAEQPGGKAKVAPRRPTRPAELALPGTFPTASTPSSSRSSNPATPPPTKAPPPTPGLSTPSLSPKPMLLPNPASPPPTESPPPIPAKSPRRQRIATRPSSQPVPQGQRAYTKSKTICDGAIGTAMSGLQVKDPIQIGTGTGEHPRPPHLSRVCSAPTSNARDLTRASAQRNARTVVPSSLRSGTTLSREKRMSAHRTSGYFAESPSSPTRIEKPAVRRRAPAKKTSSDVGFRAALQDIGAETFLDLLRSGARQGARSPRTPASLGKKSSGSRNGSGETVSMLQTSGFFSNATGVMFNPQNPNVNVELSVQTFTDRDLPTTPSSIVGTPIEMYQSPRSSLAGERRSSGSTKRSPLAQIAAIDAKVNSASPTDTASPTALHRLTTIPELSSFSENETPRSGAATPIATRIHLRGGSVVTVSPPELTAWQRSIYIQGPIKLPKPAILPRKDSVASMEPFQDAVDRVYQDALFIPRRRSDDAMVEDICEFFDAFGFEDVGYDGDLFTVNEIDVDEVDEMEIDEVAARKGSEVERFSTPPGFSATSEPTPIEKLVAKDVLETNMADGGSPTRSTIPEFTIMPVENEETLRARGIARLSRRSQSSLLRNSQFSSCKNSECSAYRRDSEASSMRKPSIARSAHTRNSMIFDGNNILPLLSSPVPSILDVVVERSSGFSDDEGDTGGMDWDDDEVQETESGAVWTALVPVHKKHALNRGLVGRDRKNPVSRMRRLVATATTIL